MHIIKMNYYYYYLYADIKTNTGKQTQCITNKTCNSKHCIVCITQQYSSYITPLLNKQLICPLTQLRNALSDNARVFPRTSLKTCLAEC